MHGYKILYGDDLNENGNFDDGKLVMHGYKILYEGELNENGNSEDEKLVMHGYKNPCMGAISTNMAILTTGNQSCMVTKFCMGVILTKIAIQRRETIHVILWDRRINVIRICHSHFYVKLNFQKIANCLQILASHSKF